MQKNYVTAGSILVLVVLFSACASVYYPLETAKESQRCKEHIENVWTQAIANMLSRKRLEQKCRLLQDEIYNRRKESTSVPFGLYWFLRKEYQRQMEEAATQMITEANRMEKPA